MSLTFFYSVLNIKEYQVSPLFAKHKCNFNFFISVTNGLFGSASAQIRQPSGTFSVQSEISYKFHGTQTTACYLTDTTKNKQYRHKNVRCKFSFQFDKQLKNLFLEIFMAVEYHPVPSIDTIQEM